MAQVVADRVEGRETAQVQFGLGSLLSVAGATVGFQEWFGVDPSVDDVLRQKVLSAL